MQWRRRHYIMVFRLYWKQAGDRQNMIIRQLNIKNSGEIHDKTLEFSPGINVLYGENESERAIVHTYIKNMFLGDISEAIYDNAVFAAKLKSPTEQDLAREAAKIYDRLSGTADSSMDWDGPCRCSRCPERVIWYRQTENRKRQNRRGRNF